MHFRIASKQTFRGYRIMVITHNPLPALKKSRRNFGLQSFLSRSSSLMANILKQIRLSTSQMVRSRLSRFYPGQDGFSTWNRISKFQRTNASYSYLAVTRQEEGLLHGLKAMVSASGGIG